MPVDDGLGDREPEPDAGDRGACGALRAEEALEELLEVGLRDPDAGVADLEQLFQRFFRTQRATSAAIPGVGLGLTIAQAIVHGHDGQISVQSRDGEGTTFRIELPLLRAAGVTA